MQRFETISSMATPKNSGRVAKVQEFLQKNLLLTTVVNWVIIVVVIAAFSIAISKKTTILLEALNALCYVEEFMNTTENSNRTQFVFCK